MKDQYKICTKYLKIYIKGGRMLTYLIDNGKYLSTQLDT